MTTTTNTHKRSVRDVSPVGTSRFERPYMFVSSHRCTSSATTPTTFRSAHTMEPASPSGSPRGIPERNVSINFSRKRAADSLFSHNPESDTYKEAILPNPIKKAVDSLFSNDTMKEVGKSPTSFTSSDRHLHTSSNDSANGSPACVLSPDDWFARFREDSEYDGTESDLCPDRATLAAVEHIPIFDADGNERTFGSLYDPATATHQRQLVIFVRHFYCGKLAVDVVTIEHGC